MGYSKDTRKLLTDAGWSRSRQFDTCAYESALRKQGFPLHASVATFLREFGGLEISIHASVGPPRLQSMNFDVAKAVRGCWFDAASPYCRAKGTQPCIVGSIWRDYGRIRMDEGGAFYLTGDNLFFQVGRSPEESIENLCQGINFIALPVPPEIGG